MHPQNLGKTLLENLRVDFEFPEFLEIQAVGFEKGDGIGDVRVGFLVKTPEIELPGAPDVAEIVEEGDTQLDEFEGIDVKAEILVAESVGSTSGRVAEKSGKLRVEGDDGKWVRKRSTAEISCAKLSAQTAVNLLVISFTTNQLLCVAMNDEESMEVGEERRGRDSNFKRSLFLSDICYFSFFKFLIFSLRSNCNMYKFVFPFFIFYFYFSY